MHAPNRPLAIWPVSLSRIESVVSAHLGAGRVLGNVHGACFSRQVSMYLAKRVGRWSLSQIGRFYNGRHHTTVLHVFEKIEKLRRTDEAVDALVDVLTAALSSETTCETPKPTGPPSRSWLIEAVASRVIDRLGELRPNTEQKLVHTKGGRLQQYGVQRDLALVRVKPFVFSAALRPVRGEFIKSRCNRCLA